MSSTAIRRVLRVFVASPSDLGEERERLRTAITEANNVLTRTLDWEIEALGWEDVLPGYRRPQALINQDVDRCHLFVGLLARRWGSPTGEYDSGFHEEYSRAESRRQGSDAPEIWLFFKRLAENELSDPGPQLNRLLEFKRSLQASNSLLFKEFNDAEQAEKILRASLLQFVILRAMSELRPVDANADSTGAIERPNQRIDAVANVSGQPTGFVDIDELTGGLKPSTLTVIADNRRTGKTTLALNIARFAARTTTVGYFSLDLSKEQLFLRLLCGEAWVSVERLTSGAIGGADYQKVSDSLTALAELPLYIHDELPTTLRTVIDKARRLKRERGVGLIVLDSLNRLRSREPHETQAMTLKGLASELSIPMILVWQSGQQARVSQAAEIAHRGSRVAQAADNVISLPDDESVDGLARVKLVAGNMTPQVIVDLASIPSIFKFSNIAR